MYDQSGCPFEADANSAVPADLLQVAMICILILYGYHAFKIQLSHPTTNFRLSPFTEIQC